VLTRACLREPRHHPADVVADPGAGAGERADVEYDSHKNG
jgi:hypothetical protein